MLWEGSRGRVDRRDARWLAEVGPVAALVIGSGLLYGLATFASGRSGRSLDESLLNVFNQQAVGGAWLQFADSVNGSIVAIVVLWCSALVTLALARRRDRTAALAVVILVVSAVITSRVLKNLIAVHHDALGASLPVSLDHTWPSTHAAAASALAMASLWVIPGSWWAALAGAAAAIISVSALLPAAHFPSDVLAGWLVAWCSMALISTAISWQRQ